MSPRGRRRGWEWIQESVLPPKSRGSSLGTNKKIKWNHIEFSAKRIKRLFLSLKRGNSLSNLYILHYTNPHHPLRTIEKTMKPIHSFLHCIFWHFHFGESHSQKKNETKIHPSNVTLFPRKQQAPCSGLTSPRDQFMCVCVGLPFQNLQYSEGTAKATALATNSVAQYSLSNLLHQQDLMENCGCMLLCLRFNVTIHDLAYKTWWWTVHLYSWFPS